MATTNLIHLPRRRWRIAWLLGLGVLVNYFDRVNLSVSQAALYTNFRNLQHYLRLSLRRIQLDLRDVPAAHRRDPG